MKHRFVEQLTIIMYTKFMGHSRVIIGRIEDKVSLTSLIDVTLNFTSTSGRQKDLICKSL